MPMTFARSLVASRNSSPTVEAISFEGLEAGSFGKPPNSFTDSSETLVTLLPVARSNHSLPMMPDSAGYAPVIIVP
jgi:hypothetical protein